jgi:hypothetical protein
MSLTDCRWLIAAALALGLAGCGGTDPAGPVPGGGNSLQATIQKLTIADLQAADTDAKAHSDAVASMCYEALIPIVQSQAPILPDSPPKGVVTAFQAARDVVNGVQAAPGVLKGLNVPCAPLVLDAEHTLIQLGLKIAPAALPILPPIP